MAIKFQYNKTSLQQLEKQLKVRVRTLPIIKNKDCLLYTSPSPRDGATSRMPSSA